MIYTTDFNAVVSRFKDKKWAAGRWKSGIYGVDGRRQGQGFNPLLRHSFFGDNFININTILDGAFAPA